MMGTTPAAGLRSRAIAGLCLAIGIGFSAAASAGPLSGPFSGLFVFGDSLSDSGNDTIITAGALPVGTVYTDGTHTGRFTNGLNYADRLAGALGLGLAPSLAGGTDYAYGGARTTTVNAGLVPYGALSFNQQLDAYYAGHGTANPDALYVLWIGANDMSDAVQARVLGGDVNAIPNAIGTAMSGIGNAIAGLASRGAQHFLVPNLPDLSLVPAVRAVGSAGFSFVARSASQAFNQSLQDTLGLVGFASLDIRGLDVYAAQTAFTANPAAFGLSNVSDACYSGEVDGQPLGGATSTTTCANPAAYLYWDYEHPSAAVHEKLATLALAAVVPEPATVALLAAGLLLLALNAARPRRRTPDA